jgi:flagellar basal body-associated protein FliL
MEACMKIRRKRIFIITTFIVIAAVAIALCVSLFSKGSVDEYDGTLVKSVIDFLSFA